MKRFVAASVFTVCATLSFGQLAGVSSAWLDAFGVLADPNVGLTAFPSLLVPAGGVLEGMGTAGTASSVDLSALESNPAAAAGRERTELGLFHREWYADGSVDTISFTLGRGPLGIVAGAKVLSIPFTAYDDVGEPTSSAYYLEIVGTAGTALRIVSAPGFSLCIGASLKLAARVSAGEALTGQSAVAFPMDLGLLADARLLDFDRGASRRNFSFGVALRNFGQDAIPSGTPLPSKLSAGIAYSPARFLSAAIDLNVPLSFDPEAAPAERVVVATGATVAVARFLSVHAGAQIAGDNPRFTLGSVVRLNRIRLVVNCTIDFLSGFDVTDLIGVGSVIDLDGLRQADR